MPDIVLNFATRGGRIVRLQRPDDAGLPQHVAVRGRGYSRRRYFDDDALISALSRVGQA